MKHDLHLHEMAHTVGDTSSMVHAFQKDLWTPVLVQETRISRWCSIEKLLAAARLLADDLIMEGRLIAGAFRLAHTDGGHPSSDDQVLRWLVFRE
jgi:hypothetical protein